MDRNREKRLAIARRAEDAIGVRFRLHGRSLCNGLDCVGLIAHAIKPLIADREIPRHYSLRFDDMSAPIAFFESLDFERIEYKQARSDADFEIGDIVLIAPAATQLHFIIITDGAYIHAHSGLRKIVKVNHPILSPIKSVWRYAGE